jgi:hypothetical protein
MTTIPWFFFMFKIVMDRGRILKKLGGDLEAQKQNVVPSKLGVDESSNRCGLELTMVIFRNSNDEITPNTYWEFRLKSGGLNCFKIYIHLIKCT